MRPGTILFICCIFASPASAQTYVTGLVGADMIRSNQVDTAFPVVPNGDGETLSTAIRVGTALSDRWGVELEFARGGEIERETTFRPPISILSGVTFNVAGVTVPPQAAIFPPITLEYTYELEQDYVTISPAAWIRQSVSTSVDLVYLAGWTFSRTGSEQRVTLQRIAGAAPIVVPVAQTTGNTSYGIGPLAGLEARFSLTEHVRLVTGVRMQGLETGAGEAWLIRASVGLGWTS